MGGLCILMILGAFLQELHSINSTTLTVLASFFGVAFGFAIGCASSVFASLFSSFGGSSAVCLISLLSASCVASSLISFAIVSVASSFLTSLTSSILIINIV